MDHPLHEKSRVVASVAPTVPTWAVYYDESTDQLFTDPVMMFNVWEKESNFRGDKTKYTDIRPVPFCSEGLLEVEDSNLLGLSLTAEPDRAEWEGHIRIYRTRP